MGKDFLNLKMNRIFSGVDVTLKLELVEKNRIEMGKKCKESGVLTVLFMYEINNL